MKYIADIVTVLVLAAFAGKGVARGLVLTVGKMITLVCGYAGAHLGATFLKGPVADKLIMPWIGRQLEQSMQANPVSDMTSALTQSGAELERYVMKALQDMGLPAFSLSEGWGRLIDRMTGTGTNIMETAGRIVAGRVSYVLVFILLFLVIELVLMILFTSIDGLKNLPIAGLLNKVGGGILGLATGGLVLWGVMAALILFAPFIAGSGGPLGPEVMKDTVVAKEIFYMAEMFLNGGY